MNNTDETLTTETPPKRHDSLRKAGQYISWLSIILMIIAGSMSFTIMLNMPAEGNMRLFAMLSLATTLILYPTAGYAIKHLFNAIADIADNSFNHR